MIEQREITLGGQVIEFETGRICKQAGGAVTVRSGDTVILAVATMSRTAREGIDFFPLTCDYEERLYSVGKIPGGFFKREGRPSERAILTSRLIDRPLRPLFPEGMRNDVQVVAMTLSVDQANPPDILAINAASAALMLSDIPWNGPVGAVRVGEVGGEFVLNPSRDQLHESALDLIVVGTSESVIMVEAGAQEVVEERLLEAMRFGHEAVQQICALLKAWRETSGKPYSPILVKKVDPELLEAVSAYKDEVRAALHNPDKAQREGAVSDLKAEIVARVAEKFPDRTAELSDAVEKLLKQELRAMILNERLRPDGRSPEQIRPISCEAGYLPRAHGSAIFTRGQTQVLSVATLGGTSEDQIIDGLGEETSKEYLHHYNFPPYSVGEVRPMRGPGRREIGHGALAERALKAVLPPKEEFPYVIRVVSDTLESNGSTSMASACGSTLALMDAGVPLKAPVSGIAMGLITEGERFAVLSDIQGMEDFGGDMDFKVAGTREGVTAIQLDTKISGIPWPVMEAALAQAREGRLFILDRMLEVLPAPRTDLSLHAPRIVTIEINPEKIGAVIGPGGKMIKQIQAETGAKIDIEQDGRVFVAAPDGDAGMRAVRMIEALTREAAVGEVFTGRVTRLMGKGAMVEYLPGKEGLIPTHELSHHRIGRPDDVVKVGDEVQARVLSIDQQGRVDLSRKALLDPELEPEPETISPPPPPRFDRDRDRERGGRGGYRDRDRDRDRRDVPPRGPRPPREEEDERRRPGGPPAGDIPARPAATTDTGVGVRFRPPKRDA